MHSQEGKCIVSDEGATEYGIVPVTAWQVQMSLI